MFRFKYALMPAAAACLLLCAASAGAQTYTTRVVRTTTFYTPTTIYTPAIAGIIDMNTASARALDAEPGRIERSGLTQNSLGEPIYVFDVRSGDMSHIVRVNALTGNVVSRFANPRMDRFDGRFGQMYPD